MTFFDIFSKKKDSAQIRKKIIVDNREKNSLVPSELVKMDFDIIFKQLPVGDYILNNIAIERKTLSDLKSSIINKRIFYQMKEIAQYPIKLLIIEGLNNEEFYEGIIHENALRGFLLSAQIDYKMPIILTKDEKDTAKYISVLANKKHDKESSIIAKKISLNKKEQARYILESFPNIGPVKAKALLEKFGSVKKVINAPLEEINEILGKKTKDFIEIIN